MTRREFDRRTKRNHGARMASDERADYRDERMLAPRYCRAGHRTLHCTCGDLLAQRAAYEADRTRGVQVISRGSKFAAGMRWRAQKGRPLLG